jgi:hypothetical protein
MFEFIKRRFVVAEVDGIKFYSENALKNYLKERELKKSRMGKHMYTFEIPWYQKLGTVSEARVGLEGFGCFDYSIRESNGDVLIQYWSDRQLLKWKNTED